MIVEIKVPSPGESITEVEIGNWLVEDGALVTQNQEIAEVESDKATLTIVASESGKIAIKAAEGELVPVGQVVCTIDTSVEVKEEEKAEAEAEAEAEEEPATEHVPSSEQERARVSSPEYEKVKVTSVAKEMMKEHNLSLEDVMNGLKRLGKKEIEAVAGLPKAEPGNAVVQQKEASREIDRQKMSSLRRKLSERLVAVKNEMAMLTTFNEIDMSFVMDLRSKNQQKFTEKHGLKLGFMVFFIKAVAIAADFYPMVNSVPCA